MRHTFVETNWLFNFAAPAHHRKPEAMQLLDMAKRGELRLNLPALCLTEVRNPIRSRCQPRNESAAIRAYLRRMRYESQLRTREFEIVDRLLNRFESAVKSELGELPQILNTLRNEPGIEIFGMNDAMLSKAVEIAFLDLSLKPFDASILAAVLVRSRELWEAGDHDLCFCELDKDLQPWDKAGPLQMLSSFYEEARLWVYADFECRKPVRPANWPLLPTS